MKKSKFIIVFTCLIVIFSMSAVISAAADYTKYDTYKTGKTTADINVRAGASTAAECLGTVSKGTGFTIYGYKKVDGVKWYRVKYDGDSAYVKAYFVKIVKKLPYTVYTPYKKGYVNVSTVNVRKGPGKSYSSYGKVSMGKFFTIKGYRIKSGKKWYRVTYKGKAAYISANCISLSEGYNGYSELKTAEVGDNGAIVRKFPLKSASKKASIAAGTEITLRGEVKVGGIKWYRIYYKGVKSYVRASAVTEAESLSYVIYTPYKTGKVTAETLDVMKGPGSDYESYAKLSNGKKITLKGYIKADGTKWYRITYDGEEAYINSEYVEITDYLSYEIYTPFKSGKTEKEINARKGPGSSYALYGSVDEDAFVTVKGAAYDSEGNLWYRITYNGNIAYISSAYVNITDPLEFTAYTPYKTGVAESDTVLRKSASADSESLGTLEAETKIKLKGYVYDSDGTKWYRIFYNKEEAYVKAEDIKTAKEVLNIATINTDVLNVRKDAGTSYDKIGSLSNGITAEILGSKEDSGGSIWYKIEYNGEYGYIHGGYVKVSELLVFDDNEFEAYMTAEGFPASYKSYLRKLHAAHPNWVFKAQKTGVSWDTVVDKETCLRVNLYDGSYDSWKSMRKGAYNFNTKSYVTFDSGTWVSAYSGLTKYCLDPRNYLNESYIYAFLDQSFDSESQSITSVKKVVDGTFLDKNYPGSAYKTYSSCIYYAAKNAGMNANVLASMIIQEQGVNGNSWLISGNYSGYKGYYNYLNIGAYRTSTMSAVQRGLWYAKQMGWNSRSKSIRGGASWYANGYINNNQNTLYLKKFNVMNGASNVAEHQYMTNVQGAFGEASHMKSAYSSTNDLQLVFQVPVYNNMPSSRVTKPATKGNNNNLLDSLKVSGYSFTESFARYTSSYTVTVPSSVDSVKVSASANYSGATVTGTGNITLSEGTNYIKVKCRSTSGLTRTYTITVKRN